MFLKSKQRWMQQPAIGNLVRELRCAMHLSQEKFADELGMTFATINRWENGHATPSPLALKQIDTLLNQLGEGGEVLRAKYSLRAIEGRRSNSGNP
jgi:putative transcriptional regulator